MDRPAPSTYHDPREVVWKHLVAQAYWDILATLRDDGVAIGDVDGIRLSFVKAFNGEHDVRALCTLADVTATTLVTALRTRANGRTADTVGAKVADVRQALRQAMESLEGLWQVDRGPSYVVDGAIMIAGRPAEAFAGSPDFVGATLELVGEHSPEVAAFALRAWRRGFVLDDEARAGLDCAKRSAWSSDDLLAEILIREQRSQRYASLREHEFVPGRTEAENRRARLRAIEEGYFLLGRLTSCIALANDHGAPLDARRLDGLCPLAATLAQAGIDVSEAQLRAFRRFTLVRCTHGLNPGEFTARIAASVRTTFPQALLASLVVRAGKLHGGAFIECSRLLEDYLAAPSREAFVAQRLRDGRLYGFGHRIHSADAGSADRRTGDPRVALQLAAVREAFPLRRETIDAFEALAALVRRMKPTLAPNTDFGAAVWFHCLGVSSQTAAGLFSIARVPGMIAQILHQLDVKPNALRPPLAVTLPYTP